MRLPYLFATILVCSACEKRPEPSTGDKAATPIAPSSPVRPGSSEVAKTAEKTSNIAPVGPKVADESPLDLLVKKGARFIRPDGAMPDAQPVQAEPSGEQFGDAEVVLLKALPKLKKLTLHTTSVTDAGLKGLAAVGSIEEVLIYKAPKVTDAGVQELQKVLPNCEIKRTKGAPKQP